MERQGPNHAVIEGSIGSSLSPNAGRAKTVISAVEGGSPSGREVAVHGLFSDLPEEYRIGIRSYLMRTLSSILADLLKHCPHHTTEPQGYLLLLEQAVAPAYHQLLRYLSTMQLFATPHAKEKRGKELSGFAMQLALELYWNIRRHVERGGGEDQQILEILDISRMPVAQAAPRPPGPPRLSPIQPWKVPDLHRERLIAHARGANADKGELRTKAGLPHLAGDPLAFRYPGKYRGLPPGYGGLPIRSTGEKWLEVGDRGQSSKRGWEGQSQGIKEDGEERVLCDDEDTDSDDSGEGNVYFGGAEDSREEGAERSSEDMQHSYDQGDGNGDGDADGDGWGDGDCDTPTAFHVEDSKLDKSVKSGKRPNIEGNDGDGEDSDDDSNDDSATAAGIEVLIEIEVQKDNRKRDKAMQRLRGAREQLRRDPKFCQLPSARQRWVAIEPSARPTAPETGSSGQSLTYTSRDMPVIIRGGFDCLSSSAKHAIPEMPFMGKSPVSEASGWLSQVPPPGASILTVLLQSHQTAEGSDPPPTPRPQHVAPLPASVPSPAAFTQPSFRSPYVRSSPPTTPSSPPSQSIPLSTQSASRTSVHSSAQYTLPASTPSPTEFSQSSFRYPYILPSTHTQSPAPPSYPSTHNHPLPASASSSPTFSQPFFTSPYVQPFPPQPQSIPWPTQFASPTPIHLSTQSHPNVSDPPSSSQLSPPT